MYIFFGFYKIFSIVMHIQQTPVDTSMFEDPEFREVYRSLEVNLYVDRTEPDPAHPTKPVIYFWGEMQTQSSSTMNGRVKMSVDNQIQWHFVSYGHFLSFLKCVLIERGFFFPSPLTDFW